ncbi:hypothetical protein JCM8208_004052 [Rhodotorula glutinis]
MGLLSRKKAAEPKQAAPPPISNPISSAAGPAAAPPAISTTDYTKKAHSAYPSQAQPQASGLPSPPRSPVEAGYAASTSHSSHQSAPRPQSATMRGPGYGGAGGQDYGQLSSAQKGGRDEQYGASSGGGYQDQRGYDDVQGKMGGLGLNGDHMSVDDADMADAANGHYGASSQPHGYQQAQPQSATARHQQQQQPAAAAASTAAGYGHQTHASRQLARQPEPTPQVVLSPTPSHGSSASRKTSSRYSLTDFTFIRTLGTGSFGRVHLVRSQHNQRSYAIKVLSKERVVKMKQVEHTNSEREMLERVRHPFLVNLWGTFKDSKNLYILSLPSRGYNKSVDWYALGVLMFEMLAGYPPFFTEDSNPMRLYEKIIAGKIRYPAYFTPEAKDLLKSLLTNDITKRFGNLANGSRDIFGHVWFQEVDWERLYRKEIPAPYVPKVDGDWDASNFDAYPEVDLSEYGSTGPDPHGHLFPLF